MKIRVLAAQAHVSTTTVLHMCKKFGCEGYTEFKLLLKQELLKDKKDIADLDISALQDYLNRLALPASQALMARNLQLIFDPEKIAIGGGISRQPKLMESLQKNLDHLNRMSASSGMPEPQVVTCKYFNDANLIGVYAYYARTRGQQ